MTGKTRRPAVSKRAVGRCETAHGAESGLTPEQSAESHALTRPVAPERGKSSGGTGNTDVKLISGRPISGKPIRQADQESRSAASLGSVPDRQTSRGGK